MPEIKHTFTSGKMNKDLDERIIPNGEYRDAMNIQVSTSEGADVGAVQNILGNSLVSGQSGIPADAYCVGSVADEKNDAFYWFVTSDYYHHTGEYVSGKKKDMILQYKNGVITPVFVDKTTFLLYQKDMPKITSH